MTFNSVYEMFNPLTETRKQRFWDWFSGDALKSYWDTEGFGSAGTYVIDDSVDGGLKITTGTSSGNQATLNFNNINQYDNQNSVSIDVVKRIDTSTRLDAGFITLSNNFGTNIGVMINNTDNTNIELRTADATTLSETAGSVAVHTNWFVSKLQFTSSNAKMTLDGVLDVTKSSNLPADDLQPVVSVISNSAGAKSGAIRYCEVYNT